MNVSWISRSMDSKTAGKFDFFMVKESCQYNWNLEPNT